jgi:hypothetical protein
MTESNKRDQYLAALNRLPITDPTEEDFASVCPHLTPAEANNAFIFDNYVASPSVKVRGRFPVLHYYPGNSESNPPIRRSLSRGFTGGPGVAVSTELSFEKAVTYANQNWGDLLLDSGATIEGSVLEIYLDDPSILVDGGGFHSTQPRIEVPNQLGLSSRLPPKGIGSLYVVLNREFGSILNDTRNKVRSQVLDEAIVSMTVNPWEFQEMKGGLGSHIEYNCAHCGSGLDLSGCLGCGFRFMDNGIRSGWDVPLSPKMVIFLEKGGHVFKQSPSIALATELKLHQQWIDERGHRSVELDSNIEEFRVNQKIKWLDLEKIEHEGWVLEINSSDLKVEAEEGRFGGVRWTLSVHRQCPLPRNNAGVHSPKF